MYLKISFKNFKIWDSKFFNIFNNLINFKKTIIFSVSKSVFFTTFLFQVFLLQVFFFKVFFTSSDFSIL